LLLLLHVRRQPEILQSLAITVLDRYTRIYHLP
jgi:hypothetical protein